MTQNSQSNLSLSFAINTLPISDNSAYWYIKRGKGKPFRKLTKDGEKWKKVVSDATEAAIFRSGFPMDMNEQGVNIALLGYTMEIAIHQHMSKKSMWMRDAHNGGKLLIDSMCDVIGLDDRYSTKLTISKSMSAKDSTMVIVEFFAGGKEDQEL